MHSDFNGFPLLQPNWTDSPLRFRENRFYSIRKVTDSNAVPGQVGSGAVDLQFYRALGTHAATGDYSFCSGLSNTASGSNSAAFGAYNISEGAGSFTAGGSNSANGLFAAAFGALTSATAAYSVTFGRGTRVRTEGQIAIGVNTANNAADGTIAIAPAKALTTDATPTELLFGTGSRWLMVNDSTVCFDIYVSARRTDANDESAAYRFEGCIDQNASAASTALVGSVTKTVLAEDTAAWDADVDADTTNGALRITVTGEAGKTIRWVAFVRTVEVTG